jgi:hypothetical protein
MKDGDQVITGPFESVRGMYEGDLVKTAPKTGSERPGQINRVTDLRISPAGARLDLGQQAQVDAHAARQHRRRLVDHHGGRADHRCEPGGSDAIVSDLGADSFTVQRMGITQNEDDFDRMRNNPLVTSEDALAIKRFATSVQSIMAQAQTRPVSATG